MNSAKDDLIAILDNERARIREAYPSNDVIFVIISIIRSMDYHAYILSHEMEVERKALLLQKYNFGWSLAFLQYYKDLRLDVVPLFMSGKEQNDWVDQIIQHSGSVQLCQQFLDYCKADLMNIEKLDSKSFEFSYVAENPWSEYLEKQSLALYQALTNRVLEDKIKPIFEQLTSIREGLKDIVQVAHGEYITYKATEEQDAFYKRFGYAVLMTTQIIDDFSEDDTFGQYKYKDYLDLIEYGFRAAIMHRDCCMALALKTSHKIYIRNILSYAFSLEVFADSVGGYLGWDRKKAKDIIACLTLNKENFETHLTYPGVSAPPYFHLGNDILMRSSSGCMDKPVIFLNRELKRKFPQDYTKGMSNREARFKSQLYDFFRIEQIATVEKNIDITSPVGRTDIDAVIFDKRTKVLALFQLKWQDTFSTSMAERFSRITNLIPTSVKWIDKVLSWRSVTSDEEVLKKLTLDGDKIEALYLFVISRNHVHFSNQHLDKRATWASWYQVIEASTLIKDSSHANPIVEFAAKLDFMSPDNRMDRDGVPDVPDFELKFGTYKVKVKGTSLK